MKSERHETWKRPNSLVEGCKSAAEEDKFRGDTDQDLCTILESHFLRRSMADVDHLLEPSYRFYIAEMTQEKKLDKLTVLSAKSSIPTNSNFDLRSSTTCAVRCTRPDIQYQQVAAPVQMKASSVKNPDVRTIDGLQNVTDICHGTAKKVRFRNCEQILAGASPEFFFIIKALCGKILDRLVRRVVVTGGTLDSDDSDLCCLD